MTRRRNDTPEQPLPAADGMGKFELPSVEDFAPVAPDDTPVQQPARVVGMDYEQWATAVISLDAAPDRIAADRLRLKKKGYKVLPGHPTVTGYANPEVWIIPRAMYEGLRSARKDRLKELVKSGQLSRTAIVGSTLVEN